MNGTCTDSRDMGNTRRRQVALAGYGGGCPLFIMGMRCTGGASSVELACGASVEHALKFRTLTRGRKGPIVFELAVTNEHLEHW